MMKNVDNSLYRGIGLYLDGKLPIGKREGLGIAEGGVGLAYNDIYFGTNKKIHFDDRKEALKALIDFN